MATKRILLTRKWDGHEAGEIVEEADFTVDSMIRKGYGELVTARPQGKGKAGKGPAVETADAPPAAENAAVTPKARNAAGKEK